MTDDEMRRLPIPSLQPDWGILALWVTGRAMELGRELLSLWGYKRVDELVWVKVNQLQRLIRTGRTGHWLKYVIALFLRDFHTLNRKCTTHLSHTCEHLLLALKVPDNHPRNEEIPWDTHPNLVELRKKIDTDVVVAEVRFVCSIYMRIPLKIGRQVGNLTRYTMSSIGRPFGCFGVLRELILRLAPHGRKLGKSFFADFC